VKGLPRREILKFGEAPLAAAPLAPRVQNERHSRLYAPKVRSARWQPPLALGIAGRAAFAAHEASLARESLIALICVSPTIEPQAVRSSCPLQRTAAGGRSRRAHQCDTRQLVARWSDSQPETCVTLLRTHQPAQHQRFPSIRPPIFPRDDPKQWLDGKAHFPQRSVPSVPVSRTVRRSRSLRHTPTLQPV